MLSTWFIALFTLVFGLTIAYNVLTFWLVRYLGQHHAPRAAAAGLPTSLQGLSARNGAALFKSLLLSGGPDFGDARLRSFALAWRVSFVGALLGVIALFVVFFAIIHA